MRQDDQAEQQERRDFLISYHNLDSTWAEWIGMQVEQAGYSVFLLSWDGHPGNDLILLLDRALRTCQRCLLVLSPAYLQEGLTQAQWAAIFQQDPVNEHRTLLPVKVEDCHPTGFLATHNPIDVSGLEETEANERLLAFLAAERLPPGQSIAREASRKTFYPGSPVTWNLPYHRNPYFTGQEEYLSELHTLLWENQRASVTQTEAISGLGGIGKTQLVVEYAYRYRADYTHVFWVRAESQESIIGSYSEIADGLQLPDRVEQDQSLMVAAVKLWFQHHHRYLLILDNADDLAMVQFFLPTACPGHVLVTTRTQHLGKFARRLELDTLSQEVGATLLLRRAGLIERHAFLEGGAAADQAVALTLTAELGGLPLALDQAGAYIEVTQCSLADYQQQYQIQRAKLLALREGPVVPGALKDDHPEPVATTWSLSFAKVEATNPMAAELLRACAFVAPDAIPEELVVEILKAPFLTSDERVSDDEKGVGFSLLTFAQRQRQEATRLPAKEGQIDEAVALLRVYSLIQRNTTERTLSVHRLVQAVLRDSLRIETQRHWMRHAVQAVNSAFPSIEFANWPTCERLLPHAFICAIWIEHAPLVTLPAARLLNQAGRYLYKRARYAEAEPLYQQALRICEQQLGANHPTTAGNLNNLALLYQAQGKYAEAEPLLKRALRSCEQQLGVGHPNAATSLNNLALLYQAQGKYAEAEPLLKRSLTIDIQVYGEEHPEVATDLNNVAELYQLQGKYAEAELFLQRALHIRERQLGTEHPDTATSLNNVAELCRVQGKYAEAELFLQRALHIRKQQLGTEHPNTSQSLNNLALLYYWQGKYVEAEPLYQQALRICEQQLGANHPITVISLSNLAELYRIQEKYAEAELLLVQTLAIHEQELGASHPDTAGSLNNLAMLYRSQGKYAEAEPLLVQALAIYKQVLGPEHPGTQVIRGNYAALLSKMKPGGTISS
jgi:tetratricopeptide (TPR) repeat protein